MDSRMGDIYDLMMRVCEGASGRIALVWEDGSWLVERRGLTYKGDTLREALLSALADEGLDGHSAIL